VLGERGKFVILLANDLKRSAAEVGANIGRSQLARLFAGRIPNSRFFGANDDAMRSQ
jgi:hypothetical protein